MEIIAQIILSYTLGEILKFIGVETIMIIFLIFALYFYYKKIENKPTILEKLLLIGFCFLYLLCSIIICAFDELNKLNQIQKELIIKQNQTIEDYRISVQKLMQNFEHLDNRLQIELEIQKLKENMLK